MGSDPFWPSYLATVNVLCVPAAAISPQRFAEVLGVLNAIQEVKVTDIGVVDGAQNDLIGASKYKGGSLFFNYTTSLRKSAQDKFPFEPNAAPQIVLGLYDGGGSGPSTGSNDEAAAEQRGAIALALSELKASYGSSRHDRVCNLLALGIAQHGSSDGVLHVTAGELETFRHAMQSISCSYVLGIRQLSTNLSDIEFNNPRASVSYEHGQLPPANGEAAASAEQGTPQYQGTPSQSAISTSEPAEHQKGRYTIVLGLLNLCIGSWPDAMRRLDEGASLAREAEDSLWQARALESLLLCMAFMAWKGETFDVPEVCLKAHATSQLLSRSPSFPNPTSLSTSLQNGSSSDLSPARRWARYAPAVARATLDLYSSLVSAPGYMASMTTLTESRIRLGNMLLFANTNGEDITPRAFEVFLLDRRIAPAANESSKRSSPDTALANMMLDTLSAPVDDASESEILSALAAVISSLSQLGSSRRHAFLFRGLLQKLVPILVRARKLGASEAGIHPVSAVSAASNGAHVESHHLQGDFRSLLDAAARSYDIDIPGRQEVSRDLTSSIGQLQESLAAWHWNQTKGDVVLKLEMLQLCVKVSDALPDLRASLDFTTCVLRCGLRAVTISMTSVNQRPALLPEEQIHLVEGLKRTVSTAQRLGFDNLRADYWDDFLVRDVQYYQSPNAATLISHKASELSLVEEGGGESARDPFIFNPFAKAHTPELIPVIVAGELVTFSVILQNPLEIEIDVGDICLLTEGCDFEPSHHSIILGPFWSQAFSLTGTPHQSGSMRILGCRATIAGCHERDFPIIVPDWKPPRIVKPKTVSRSDAGAYPDSDRLQESLDLQIPNSKTVTIKVIERQPHLVVKATSLPQASLMLLEGEKTSFRLTVGNESGKVHPDFLLFTYDDNVTSGLQEALGRKDLLPVDTYEVQYQLRNRPTITMAPEDVAKLNTEAHSKESTTYHFDLTGRPGLVRGAVQMDFAYLGVPKSEITQTFYTRQERFPFDVTVNGSIDIPRCNILPIEGGFPWLNIPNEKSNCVSSGEGSTVGEGFCMLSFDLRNIWPHTLSVELISRLQTTSEADSSSEQEPPIYRVQEDLQPGHVSRVILLVPRLFIQDPYAPIPSLITQRQYVVSASKQSLEAEAASRETFWYREELLKHISGTWKEVKTGRNGQIDLRKGVRLNSRTIDVLKVDHVDISFTITPSGNDVGVSDAVKAKGNGHSLVQTESFVTLQVRVHNRSKDQLRLLLRLQPALRDQPHNIALDLSRRLAWSGVLQQALHPPLDPGDSREANLDLVVLAEGNYEVNATVEEIKGRGKTSLPAGADGISVSPERRIWHARSPCLIDAFNA